MPFSAETLSLILSDDLKPRPWARTLQYPSFNRRRPGGWREIPRSALTEHKWGGWGDRITQIWFHHGRLVPSDPPPSAREHWR